MISVLAATGVASLLLCLASLSSSGFWRTMGPPRARLRMFIAAVALVRGSALLAEAAGAFQSGDDKLVTAVTISWPRAMLESFPSLLALSLYTFIGCYFVHVMRLISGAGNYVGSDNAGAGGRQATAVRVYAKVANAIIYGGYAVVMAVALIFHRGDSLWRWHHCFLAAIGLAGSVIMLFLGKYLRSLLHEVPSLSCGRRTAMVARTTQCLAITGTALVLRAIYRLLLATSLLGNNLPFPIRSIAENTSTTQIDKYVFECNVAESLAVVMLELLPLMLLLCVTKREVSSGRHSDASLGVEELTSPLTRQFRDHANSKGTRNSSIKENRW